MSRLQAALVLALSVALTAAPADARDAKVRAEFQRLHPCPANDQRRGPCPGWVGDHIIPLCLGGPDSVKNMQWQEVEEAKRKDKVEGCHRRKNNSATPCHYPDSGVI